ncbi:hypothetical protein BHM03_00018896 [Ensete ventricosum]|nr:hypothetical protein BHM03_00018896 [Ensete ventricosum]
MNRVFIDQSIWTASGPQLKPVGSLSLHETPNSPPSGSLALTLSLSPASSMMDGGTSAGGDGFLSPICIFLLVVALQTLDGLLELVKRVSEPSTFAQSAKLRRLAAAKEKELQKSM